MRLIQLHFEDDAWGAGKWSAPGRWIPVSAPATRMPASPAELRRRLVAAYLGGCQVGHDTFRILRVAQTAEEVGGVIPWVTAVAPRTYSALATGKMGRLFTSSYCHLTVAPMSVNMLTWTLKQGETALHEAHPGALVHVPPERRVRNAAASSTGSGGSSTGGDDGGEALHCTPYHAWYLGMGGLFPRAHVMLQPGACACVVRGEAAQVVAPVGAWLSWYDPLGFDRLDLHLVDFEIWWAPIRANAILRAEQWFQRKAGRRYAASGSPAE